ncbi:hypothetical protein DID88_002640 [Monilinia fructigena]|uniref:Uncharacterized protein n=1 Tax=Monilinia fructigena TaxID=38457 RepID=A0A395IPY6_9HELO|nr:hypothetical protein DID88_002640 [Monilinia fructigena]
MHITIGEAAALFFIALPSFISALPVNSGSNVEQLVPLNSRDVEVLVPITPGHSKRDFEERHIEKLIPISPSHPKRDSRDVELLVPITGRDIETLIPITSGHSKRDIETLTIPPVEQLDPGSISPDAIATVEKRKTIPAVEQSDAGSISPTDIHGNDKRQEYAHTKTIIATVMETVTGGIGIPGYPATAVSDTTSQHISTVSHPPYTVTAIITANPPPSTKISATTPSKPTTPKTEPHNTESPSSKPHPTSSPTIKSSPSESTQQPSTAEPQHDKNLHHSNSQQTQKLGVQTSSLSPPPSPAAHSKPQTEKAAALSFPETLLHTYHRARASKPRVRFASAKAKATETDKDKSKKRGGQTF